MPQRFTEDNTAKFARIWVADSPSSSEPGYRYGFDAPRPSTGELGSRLSETLVFFHSCRGRRASLSPNRAALRRPDQVGRPFWAVICAAPPTTPKGRTTDLTTRKGRPTRLLMAFHRLAVGSPCPASRPRRHLCVQERLLRHEERNADQCLPARGVPDRDH